MNLKRGMISIAVANLQKNLVQIGIHPLEIDSNFGPQTEIAVKGFQANHGLRVDGIVGVLTQAAITKALIGQLPSPLPVPAPVEIPEGIVDFEKSITFVLKNEGGYSNDSHDSGGATNFGITKHDLEVWRKKSVTNKDVQNMTLEEAKDIYKAKYWLPLNCHKLVSQGLATAIVDVGVLYGIGTSAKYARSSVNSLGGSIPAGTKLDDYAIDSINKLSPHLFLQVFHSSIRTRIDLIIAGNYSQEKFRKGWEARADRLLTLA